MRTRSLAPVAVLVCSFAVLGVGLSGTARAQGPITDRTFSPQLFHPSVGPDEFFTLQPAKPLEHMNYALGLWLNYSLGQFAVSQVSYDKNGSPSVNNSLASLVKNNIAADLVFAIGLLNRLQLGVGLPVVLYQDGDSQIEFPNGNVYSVPPASGFALGDPWIDAKVRLLGLDRGGPQLSLAGMLTLPLSRVTADSYSGDPNVTVAVRALAGFEGTRWRGGLNFGFLYRAHESHFFSTTIGNELLYGAAVAFDVADQRKASLVVELHGRTDISGTRITNIDASPLEVDAGVKLRLARAVTITLGAGTGVIKGLGSPLVRAFAGITYTPDRRDRDKDGVPDLEDKCADEPEDRDGFRDDDGCPEPDNDGDGIPDARDKCPNEAEDFDAFQDDDGCPEPDNDGDGMLDIKDACPLEKEDGKQPRPADGCPFDKTDSDEDGVPDNKDKCPLEQEDKDGFEDSDGCIDPDNDGDDVPDSFDKCPNEAEDYDKYQDDDGCPERDNDGDGILDGKDKCPNEAEVINGFQDEDGCADRGPPMKVQIVGDEIVLLEKVQFKTAKAIIEGKSFFLLDQAVSILRLHPELRLVLIEGHTDGKGSVPKNVKLSQDRADAVKAYLVKKGIAAGRLEAKGFGPYRPVADNKTERGREANRRVQFKILENKK